MSLYSKIENAVRETDYDLVKELISKDKHRQVDLGMDSNKLLRIACSDGDMKIIKTILKRKEVDPSSDSSLSPIRAAYSNNHVEVVRLLLKDKRVVKSLDKDDLLKYREFVPTSKTKENLIVGLTLTVFGLILNEIVDKYV